jgi:serine-type D-Ala-D-Ala carboxypeptidase (penicillin-binding protein 5/6)
MDIVKKKSKYIFSWFYLLFLLIVISLEVFFLLNKMGVFYKEPSFEVTFFSDLETPTYEASSSAVMENISANSYFVIDNTSQTIVLEKNPQLPLPPASTTKLMTVFTALKKYDFNEVVSVSTASALKNDGGGLYPLEKVRVKDLAAASLVRSANDAAYALADHFPGGYFSFVEEMNKEAKEINLTSTRFENPVGYDHPDNVSTAHDLAVLTMRVFKEPAIAEWMGLKNYIVENESKTIRHFLFSTNELLGGEEGVIAGKTGTTPMAKEVLISIAEINDHQYILVIMGSEDRYGDTKILLNWIKENLKWEKVEFPLQINVKSL